MISLQSINNFDVIESLLHFPDNDSFYSILIFRTISDGNLNHSVLKHYDIFSIENSYIW